MEEVVADIQRWRSQGEKVALATVVQTWGSSPRRVGAKMAITANGQLSGSVSGGCVEGAVAEEAFAVLESGRPKLLHYGVADEMGWEVGLACGGNIQVFVEPLDAELFTAVTEMLQAERAGALATVIAGPDAWLGRKLFVESGQEAWQGGIDAAVDVSVAKLAKQSLARGNDEQIKVPEQGIELFIDVLLPPPTLVMVGGVHIAIALATLAKTLGYRTIVVDPRHAFGTVERFAHVDQLLRAWPEEAFAQLTLNENMAVAILTHDPKIDDPALQSVLRSPAFYIGALGSRKTHGTRIERLRLAGFTQLELDRIHAPIGLQIGAQTPEEIALAILAECVKVRHGVRSPEAVR
jgi:xanthine dehydrogenase accessory factor